MKFADAFPREVRSVTLYVFDRQGRLVTQRTEQGETLAAQEYSMPLDIEPGDYRFIAWAGLEGQESFSVPAMQPGVSVMTDLTCRMNRTSVTWADGTQADSVGYLKPLWHGQTDATLSRATVNTQYVTLPLTKDTHTLRIILQQLAEGELRADDFDFTVCDDNGLLAHNNLLLKDDTLTYKPYYRAQGSADLTGSAEGQLNMAVAELSIGRLMTDHHPQLTITRTSAPADTVLSIPLIDYLALCKTVAHYDMPTQEYLDREDEYSMTFFLDRNHHWVNTQIIINNWIVRYNDITPDFK